MPLRSSGCFKCRKRKIRCDLTRPGCKRCATHGVECPGYRTENAGDVEFQDQTVLTLQRAGNEEVRWPSKSTSGSSKHSPSISGTAVLVAPVTTLQSPQAQRTQIYSAFMDTYIPQNFLAEEMFLKEAHFGWVPLVASMTPAQPALTNAFDAISLVRLGNLLDDKQLLRKSVEAYTNGLCSLAKALSKPDSVYDDQILAASAILCQCEIFNEIRQHGKGWLGHLQGLEKIITARGPRALDSRLSLMIFYQSTRTSLASAMLMRKKAYYSAPRWLAAQVKIDMPEDYSDSYRSGQLLPGLLERCDNLDLSQSGALAEVDDLLGECEMLRSSMIKELARTNVETSKYGKACFELVDVSSFTTFPIIVQDRTLTRAFWFRSYLAVYLYSQHWLRMYMLRSCMQRLHLVRRQLVPSASPDDDEPISEWEILGYVINLCRCVPYMVEPSNGAVGTISSFFPVHVATEYFREHKHRRWLSWINTVRNSIFDKGLSIPVVAYDDSPFELEDETSWNGDEDSFNWIESVGGNATAGSLGGTSHIGSPWDVLGNSASSEDSLDASIICSEFG